MSGNAARPARRRRPPLSKASRPIGPSSPALAQPAVEPVPQKIKQKLSRATRRIVDRKSQPDIRANMLPLAERHLELRQEVPVRLLTRPQLPVGEQLHHWRPKTAEPHPLPEALADHGAQEHGIVG